MGTSVVYNGATKPMKGFVRVMVRIPAKIAKRRVRLFPRLRACK